MHAAPMGTERVMEVQEPILAAGATSLAVQSYENAGANDTSHCIYTYSIASSAPPPPEVGA